MKTPPIPPFKMLRDASVPLTQINRSTIKLSLVDSLCSVAKGLKRLSENIIYISLKTVSSLLLCRLDFAMSELTF